MNKLLIPFKSQTGIALNIPFDQLIELLEDYHTCKLKNKKPVKFPRYVHEWIDEPGYDPLLLDKWLSKLKDGTKVDFLARELRDHLSGYFTRSKLRETILKSDWKAFMKAEWVRLAIQRHLMIQAGREIGMKEGSIAAHLFITRLGQQFQQPMDDDHLKKEAPIVHSLMKRYGTASRKEKDVRISDYFKSGDLGQSIKQTSTPPEKIKNKKSQLQRDRVIVELLVMIETCEKQLSKRSQVLVCGLTAAWLGFLPEEKSGDEEEKYKENITNAVRATKEREINKYRKR